MSNPYDTLKERTSILGPTIHFKGELSAEEDLVIRGTIEGCITRTQKLTIGREGTVHANIDAQLIVIEGSIEGDIRAEKSVAVSATAQVTGNITAPAVAILQGATFNGTIDMSGNQAASADVTASQVLRGSTSGA